MASQIALCESIVGPDRGNLSHHGQKSYVLSPRRRLCKALAPHSRVRATREAMVTPMRNPEFVYKIASHEAVSRSSPRRGAFPGMPIDARTATSISRPPRSSPRRCGCISRARATSCCSPSAPTISARRCAGSPRAAASSSPISMATSRHRRASAWHATIGVAADGSVTLPEWVAMILSRLSPLLRVPLLAGLTRDSAAPDGPRDRAWRDHHRPAPRPRAASRTGPIRPNSRPRSPGSNSTTPSAWPPASTRTARCRAPLALMGFGMVEVGTVTPRPQAGNPKPRLFRVARRRRRHQPHGLQQ